MASLDKLQSQLQQTTGKEDTGYDETTAEPMDSIEITCDSIDEGIEEAIDRLNVSRINLDYEILQQGKKGVLGIGKKPFVIKFWKSSSIKPEDKELMQEVEELAGPRRTKEEETNDGQAKVVIRKSGVYLVITPPKENGQPVDLKEVTYLLAQRNIKNYNKSQIKNIVKNASGEPAKIAEWKPNPEYDSKASIEVSQDKMKAYLTVTAPILSGRILEEEEIKQMLADHNVVYGIKEDKIKEVFEKEIYNVPVVVAEGKPPEHGQDANIDFKFKIDISEIALKENEKGQIDFKELNKVQNVVAGQVLAEKEPATIGVPGRTVTNERIDAQNGNEVPFEPGSNAVLSENGLQIIAQIPGQAIFQFGKISVEPIYEVEGDVDLKQGNIVFLGTVIVKGNVQDGFSVKAGGDIKVFGNVGKAELEADNDIIVNQGIQGHQTGTVKAGNNVYAKFIENANITARVDVIVRENILFSKVDAGGRVIVNGKRGVINGGRIRAGQEINSKNLGSESYADTILEAGIDPKNKEKLQNLEEDLLHNEENLHKITVNINTLKAQKEKDGQLPKEKEAYLKRMIKTKREIISLIQELTQDIDELREYLNNLDENVGKISSKNKVYPGVDIIIKNASYKVKTEFKSVTFINDNGFIRPLPYQEVEDLPEPESYDRRR